MLYTMEEKTVHSSGLEKVIFLSTLDEPRNKSKISKIWDVTVSGGPFYKKSTNRGIEYYQEKNVLEKKGNSFSANLDSEAVREDFEEAFEDSSDVNQYFKHNLQDFIEFLENDLVTEKLLAPQTIREVFGEGKQQRLENIREENLTRYFVLISISGIKLWVDNRSETFFGDYPNSQMIQGMVKGMFLGLFQQVDENSDLRIGYLAEQLEEIYQEDEEDVEFILDSYDEIITNQIEQSLPT